ncbi:MAG: hypothetical protein KBC38_00350 [Candidatus Pacebacteria bacterium]|nr:hypothetical protein [Candidatus Paceibacterota bacterium]MBP9840447.1 hypothetical protein [Candidatus Paceibacterota bacterium]
MDDFLKMDVFFVVATGSMLILSAFAAIILWRIARILKEVERVTREVAAESELIRADIEDFRGRVRTGKATFRSFMRLIGNLGKHGRSKDD